MTTDKHIIRSKAIEAKCHDCMGAYSDGLMDCEVVMCALYTFMPYRKLEPCLEWTKHSHRRIGVRAKKEMTEKQRANIENMHKLQKETRFNNG